MNHTDTVPTGEREADAFDRATESAEMAIYEKLKDLFGAQGENLAEFLGRSGNQSAIESIEVVADLRAAYRKRVAADANRIVGN